MPLTPLRSSATRARGRTLLALAFLVAFGCARAASAADPKAVCASAAEDAQLLRREAKLRAAREKFVICARDVCPDVVRDDCQKWLAEVESALPTVVFRARDVRGQDVIVVRVAMDGKPIAQSLDGKAISVDPGSHRVRYEVSGADPIELEVLVSEGERNRVLLATFPIKLTSAGTREREEAISPAPGLPVPKPAEASSTTKVPSDSRSVGPIIVGAAGLVALGIFGVLDVTAWSDVRELRRRCGQARDCPQDEVDAVDTRITAAKVSFAVGIVALAAGATWFVLDTPKKSSHAARVRVSPGTQGATMEAAWSF